MSDGEEITEWLRRSKNALGQIYPILIKKGSFFEIVDGRHRSQADPTWRTVEIEPPEDWPLSEEAYYLAVRIAANYRRRVSRKERQTDFLMLASQLEEEGIPREKIVSTISKITGFSERWVRKLLPSKYKATEKAPPKEYAELIPHPKIEKEATEIVTSITESKKELEKTSRIPTYVGIKEAEETPKIEKPYEVAVEKSKPRLVLPKVFTCPRCHVEIKTVYCTRCFSELSIKDIVKILRRLSK